MFDRLKNLILNKYLGSLIRHALTALVGILLASDFPGLSEVGAILKDNLGAFEQAIAAIALGLVALVWSFKEKKAS